MLQCCMQQTKDLFFHQMLSQLIAHRHKDYGRDYSGDEGTGDGDEGIEDEGDMLFGYDDGEPLDGLTTEDDEDGA